MVLAPLMARIGPREKLELRAEVSGGQVALKGETNSPPLFMALIKEMPSVYAVKGVKEVTLDGVKRL